MIIAGWLSKCLLASAIIKTLNRVVYVAYMYMYMHMYLLPLLCDPDKGSGSSQVQDVGSYSHAMVQNACDLCKQCANELCPGWDIDAHQSLDGK